MPSSLLIFEEGEWADLLEQARTAWPLGRPSSEGGPRVADETRKQADRLINAVADGNLGEAAAQLQSSGVAPATDAVADMIRGWLCQQPDAAVPSREWVDKHKDNAIRLNPNNVAQALRKAKRGGCAELAG